MSEGLYSTIAELVAVKATPDDFTINQGRFEKKNGFDTEGYFLRAEFLGCFLRIDVADKPGKPRIKKLKEDAVRGYVLDLLKNDARKHDEGAPLSNHFYAFFAEALRWLVPRLILSDCKIEFNAESATLSLGPFEATKKTDKLAFEDIRDQMLVMASELSGF